MGDDVKGGRNKREKKIQLGLTHNIKKQLRPQGSSSEKISGEKNGGDKVPAAGKRRGKNKKVKEGACHAAVTSQSKTGQGDGAAIQAAAKQNIENQTELARKALAESDKKRKKFEENAPKIRVFLYNNKKQKKKLVTFVTENKDLRRYSNKYFKFLLEKKFEKINSETVKDSFQIKDFDYNTYLDLIDDIVLNSKELEESKDVGLCFEFDNFELGEGSDKEIILGAQLSFAMKCRAVLGDDFKITFKIGGDEVFSGNARQAVEYVEACYKLDVAHLEKDIRLGESGKLVKYDDKGNDLQNDKSVNELNKKLNQNEKNPDNLIKAKNEINKLIEPYQSAGPATRR